MGHPTQNVFPSSEIKPSGHRSQVLCLSANLVAPYTVTGELEEMHFYACLGSIIPFTKPVFSYLYYTRAANVPMLQVQEAVARDVQLYDFDMNNLIYTNTSAWETCGVL